MRRGRGHEQHHALARNSGSDERALGGAVHLLDGIHRRHAGNSGAVLGGGGDDGSDEFGVNEGPHCVVHEHNVVIRGFNAGQRVGHRLLAMVAALDHAHRFLESFFVQARLELLDLFLA